jgi:hypothetical protein
MNNYYMQVLPEKLAVDTNVPYKYVTKNFMCTNNKTTFP